MKHIAVGDTITFKDIWYNPNTDSEVDTGKIRSGKVIRIKHNIYVVDVDTFKTPFYVEKHNIIDEGDG